jgi:hypothetical protein
VQIHTGRNRGRTVPRRELHAGSQKKKPDMEFESNWKERGYDFPSGLRKVTCLRLKQVVSVQGALWGGGIETWERTAVGSPVVAFRGRGPHRRDACRPLTNLARSGDFAARELRACLFVPTETTDGKLRPAIVLLQSSPVGMPGVRSGSRCASNSRRGFRMFCVN